MTDAARWKATIYIGGLAPMVTPGSLHDAFVPFGEIADVSLPRSDRADATDTRTGESAHRGFAYVEYEDPDDARDAVDNMDQAEFYGRVLRVSAAKPPKSAEEGLGSKTAVWEQEGWLAEHAVSEEDRLATDRAKAGNEQQDRHNNPMQGLEGLDVAGPRPE